MDMTELSPDMLERATGGDLSKSTRLSIYVLVREMRAQDKDLEQILDLFSRSCQSPEEEEEMTGFIRELWESPYVKW